VSLQPLVGALFVHPHQARKPRHVGCEDCARRRTEAMSCPAVRYLNEIYLKARCSPSVEIAGPVALIAKSRPRTVLRPARSGGLGYSTHRHPLIVSWAQEEKPGGNKTVVR
jgi:hypothetical protein